MLKLGINEVSSAEYHSDREYVSSSVLKTVNKSIEEYYKQYILGEKKEAQSSTALDDGSYVHSRLLEPQLTDAEFAIFDGVMKRGKEFERFKADNEGKIILNIAQKHRCDMLVKACKANSVAMDLLNNSQKEVSLCVEMDGVKVKVRADALDVANGRIIDIKTSRFSSEHESVKLVVKDLSYDLSAALYTAAFSQFYQKHFDFYFAFLSKADYSCEVYKLSERSRSAGMSAVDRALGKLKKARSTGIWTEESVEEPSSNSNLILEV